MQIYDSPLAWRGEELKEHPEWEYFLNTSEINEIKEALKRVKDRDMEMTQIKTDDFPLPNLSQKLQSVGEALEKRTGSFFLRGWPNAEFDIEDNRLVFWGISRHLGTPISQSALGEMMYHVRDEGYKMGHPKARGPNTSKELNFHCDRCDVIGFMCINQARSGGDNYLVSSLTVHNEMLKRRPDLLEQLYQPYYYKTHNVDLANPDRWCHQPIFAIVDGYFVGYILRVLIDRAYELPELPEMTTKQKEALDFLEQICEEPDIHYKFRQRPGDMLFVNNFVNFHSRTRFEDHEAPEKKRLLLRIWLATPNSRPLPSSFKGSFGKSEPGSIRGGIHKAPN